MTTSKSLPARPSLESLRKQANKLARDIAAGEAGAVARARAHLPNIDLPLTQRNAQLVIAREYGYAGWQDLTAEVSKRLGKGLEWAVAQARRTIHDNDIEHLKQLLAEYPALLSWKDNHDDSGLLGMATSAYGDAGDAQREQWFTRGACAELLIDAGAVVMPSVCEGLLRSGAGGLLELFQRKGVLPRTLKFFATLGDLDGVRAALNENGNGLKTVNEAFVTTRTVAVYATVTAPHGRLAPDLARDNFEVDDNGVKQELTVFSNDVQPITGIMPLDRSGSMKPNLELEVRAAETFIHACSRRIGFASATSANTSSSSRTTLRRTAMRCSRCCTAICRGMGRRRCGTRSTARSTSSCSRRAAASSSR
jgi:hypothetical protein